MARAPVRQRHPPTSDPSGARPGAPRPIRTHAGPRRTASSAWLPWLAGLLVLLSIAATTALLGGRIEGGVAVPSSILDLQEASVAGAAQQIRIGLEGGVRDVAQLAGVLAAAPDAAVIKSHVDAFAKRYHRYRSVYVLDGAGSVVAANGQPPHPSFAPQNPRTAGVTDAVRIDNVSVVLQYAPVNKAAGPMILIAEYDLARLRYALDGMRPATAWIVNDRSEVVASTTGFVAFERLDSGKLAKAVAACRDRSGASLRSGGIDAGEIIAYGPLRDSDPSPVVPKWGLVSTRGVSTLLLPQGQARDQALLVGLALTIVTVGVFGWMYVMWLRPLRQLVRDAHRVANGDLSVPVNVRRHDEIGLIARSIERIRVGLVRDLTSMGSHNRSQTTRPEPQEFD